MNLRKYFLLCISLFSSPLIAAEDLQKESTFLAVSPIITEQVFHHDSGHKVSQKFSSFSEIPENERRIAKKEILRKNREAWNEFSNNSIAGEITVDLKTLTYEQFLSLMIIAQEKEIPLSLPPAHNNIFSDVSLLYRKPTQRIRVLSLDGGGVRGIIEALILADFERRTEKKIHELFDVIVGTSTASFIIAAACLPKPNELGSNNPYKMEEVVEFYKKEAARIFSYYNRMSFNGVNGTQYNDPPLMDVLKQYYGDKATLSDLGALGNRVFLTGFDLNKASPILFSSDSANRHDNPTIVELVRAVVSAPTYFDPIKIGDKLIGDGGLAYNCPVMVAITEACKAFNCSPHDLEVVALGTGYALHDSNESYINKSALAWLKTLLNAFFNGQNQHLLAKDLLDITHMKDPSIIETHYTRLQCILSKASDDLANYEVKNMENLVLEAEKMIEDNEKIIETLCQRLKR